MAHLSAGSKNSSLMTVRYVCCTAACTRFIDEGEAIFATVCSRNRIHTTRTNQIASESRACCLALLQELRTVVLINCGAGHFARDLQPASAQGVRFVVVDSHRPVCPKYNDADDIECVLLLDEDDPLSLQQIPQVSDLDRLSEERELAQVMLYCLLRLLWQSSRSVWPPTHAVR
jgi:hypothetical protein